MMPWRYQEFSGYRIKSGMSVSEQSNRHGKNLVMVIRAVNPLQYRPGAVCPF